MSFMTWKMEFYRTEAKAFYRKKSLKNMKAAIEHSIIKWTGLLSKNSKKHKVFVNGNFVHDSYNGLAITDETCALCYMYFIPYRSCKGCPLFIVRKRECDKAGPNEEAAPYAKFLDNGTATPMLYWLRKARKYVEQLEKRKSK